MSSQSQSAATTTLFSKLSVQTWNRACRRSRNVPVKKILHQPKVFLRKRFGNEQIVVFKIIVFYNFDLLLVIEGISPAMNRLIEMSQSVLDEVEIGMPINSVLFRY